MNSEHERELELEIDRELKSLRELEAPGTLARRVLLAIEQRRAVRWYNQPWQNWPVVLRISAMALLSIMFGGLCVASWQLTKAAGVSTAFQEVAGLFSGLTTLWNIVNVLLGAIVLVAKHLGTGFMIGCVVIAGLVYALCLGLGTAWVRLAFARR
jgi:uncharacterized membrane protein